MPVAGWRLTLWYLLVVAILVTFFGIVAYVNLSHWIDAKTVSPTDMKVARVEKAADGSWVTTLTNVLPDLNTTPWKGTSILSMRLEPRNFTESNGRQYISLPSLGGESLSIDTTGIASPATLAKNRIWMYLYQTAATPGKYDIVFTIEDGSRVAYWLSNYREVLVATGLATLILAGILGFFLVSRMLRPVQAITRTARGIQDKNLDQRLEVNGNDELGQLASTLNRTFARLEAAFVREREFTADASHELRTPLAIAQGEASLALREDRTKDEYRTALEAVSGQISKASSLISRLLFLARSDDRLELNMAETDLAALLNEVASDAQVLCDQKGITLQLDVAGPPSSATKIAVRADPVRLRELFLNLLDNAVRYTPGGGTITVSLRRDGSWARAAVRDTGVGIPAEHLSSIFKRFYRVDKSRSRSEGGAGLGLAISQRIAEVHGGRIEVESELGKGSVFTVFLPLTAETKGGRDKS